MYLALLTAALSLASCISAQNDGSLAGPKIPETVTFDYEVGVNNPYTIEKTSAQAIALPIVGIMAILLLIAPFVVQWRGRNIGQCSQIFYISLANLFAVTNAILWPNFNYMEWWEGYGFCDVQAKLQQPIITGVACATVCITRRLAIAINPDKMKLSENRRERIRIIVEDCAICFLIPLLQIALHYPVQFNRYYLTAVGGCMASYDSSWPTIVFMYIWPLVFCLINCYYSILIIYRLRQYRHQVASLLGNSRKNLSMFLRLLMNSLLLVLIYTPVSVYFFYINVNIPWFPYDFTSIHEEPYWSTIIFLPNLGVRTADRWTHIAMSLFVFLFFGTGQHALECYRSWLLAVGFGSCFPVLKERGRQGSTSTVGTESKTWLSRWSLIRRVRHYFENIRQRTHISSHGTSSNDNKDEYGTSSRKHSLLPTFHHYQTSPSFITATTASSHAAFAPPNPRATRNDSTTPLNLSSTKCFESHAPTSLPNLTAGRQYASPTHHGFSSMANASSWLGSKLWSRLSPTPSHVSPLDTLSPSPSPPAPVNNTAMRMTSTYIPSTGDDLDAAAATAAGFEGADADGNSVQTRVWSEHAGRESRLGSYVPGMGEVKVKKSVVRSESSES